MATKKSTKAQEPTETDFEKEFGPSGQPATVASSGDERKSGRCDACDARFVPLAAETVCAACTKKAQTKSGRQRCLVRADGFVVAQGILDDDSVKTQFRDGDRAHFTQQDIESLPTHLIPI